MCFTKLSKTDDEWMTGTVSRHPFLALEINIWSLGLDLVDLSHGHRLTVSLSHCLAVCLTVSVSSFIFSCLAALPRYVTSENPPTY